MNDGQRPLPFKTGLPKSRMRARVKSKKERWALPGGWVGKTCPMCGCSRDVRCRIVLSDGESEGQCVPAGMWGRKVCSACVQPALPGLPANG